MSCAACMRPLACSQPSDIATVPVKASTSTLPCTTARLPGLSTRRQIIWFLARVPKRLGNAHPNIAPYQTFAASDEYLAVAVGNDQQFARFAEAIGLADIAMDARFRRNRDRLANLEDLQALIQAEISKDTALSWEQRLLSVGVPAGRVATIDTVLTDPHTLAREMVVELPGDETRLRFVCSAIQSRCR